MIALLAATRSSIRTRVELEAQILALRHQLAVLQQAAPRRPRFSRADRLFWVLLSRVWTGWRRTVHIVRPATVVCWHRRLFALHWRWRSTRPRIGRPTVAPDIRDLIRRMNRANPLRGAPRIHGELRKLGLDVSQTTVEKVSWASTHLAVTDVAHVPEHARLAAGDRLFHRPHCDVPRSICPAHPVTRRLIGTLRRECLDHVLCGMNGPFDARSNAKSIPTIIGGLT
jgi:hypothetical protein